MAAVASRYRISTFSCTMQMQLSFELLIPNITMESSNQP